MTTASTLINDAADLAGVLAEGQSLSGNRSSRFLRELNRMISGWENDGLDLGLSTLSLNDTVYVDSADEDCLVYSLAVRIYEISKRTPNPMVYNRARDLYNNLEAKYLDIQEMPMPPELQSNKYYDINKE